MKDRHFPAYLQKLLDKYKYVLLVLALGMALLLWPQEDGQAAAQSPETSPAQSDTTALENRIQTLLESMEGVGQARVMLTLESGEETVYAYDRTESRNDSDSSTSETHQRELVTLSDSGGQTPVELRHTAPVYRGAVVVCQGADSAAVRLAVTQVIQSLTDLSADRIVISKMKQ